MKTNDTQTPALTLVKGNKGALTPKLTTRDFRINPKVSGDFDDLIEISQHRKALEKQERKLQRRIQMAMGKAQKAVFINGYAQWVKGRDQVSLNTQAVLENFPALLDEFPQVQVATPTLQFHGKDVCLEFMDGGEHEYP